MASKKYGTVLKWWEAFHDTSMIANAVVKGWITAEEYEEITGEPYGEGE